MFDRPRIDLRSGRDGQPGTHALVVGISRYPNLPDYGQGVPEGKGDPGPGLGLTSQTLAAYSAFRIYRWLVDNADRLVPPLATCRLLLAPMPEELDRHDDLKKEVAALGQVRGTEPRCDMEAFLTELGRWRKDASENQQDATFFYFAGNGFEIEKGDPLIALEDFGSGVGPLLRATCPVEELFRGMAPTLPDDKLARTQLYFIDTDRDPLQPLVRDLRRGTTAPFDLKDVALDNRSAVVFYATSSGTSAIALRDSTTLFSSALDRSLSRLAAVPRFSQQGQTEWVVTVASLADCLPKLVSRLASKMELQQEVAYSGLIRDATVVRLDRPPKVKTRIRIVPPEAAAGVRVELLDLWSNAMIAFVPDDAPEASSGTFRPTTPDTMIDGGHYRVAVFDGPSDGRSPRAMAILQALPIEPLLEVEVPKP
jgi:hypothetical protein